MDALSLHALLSQRVVLDTQGPMIYIGTLAALDERGYWLLDADVHDRAEGHSSKEAYVSEARMLERSGVRRSNRRRVFVERAAIISVSALADVADEDAPLDEADGDAAGREGRHG